MSAIRRAIGRLLLWFIQPARKAAVEDVISIRQWAFEQAATLNRPHGYRPNLDELLVDARQVVAFIFKPLAESGNQGSLIDCQKAPAALDADSDHSDQSISDNLGAPVRPDRGQVLAGANQAGSGNGDGAKCATEKVENIGLSRPSCLTRDRQQTLGEMASDDGRAVPGWHEIIHVETLIGGVAAPMMAKEGEGGNALPSGRAG